MFNKINLYVIKEFCKMFIYITLSTILLVFFIDFLEFYSKVEKYNIKILDAIRIVLYKTPEIIDTALYFIILLSSSFTLTKFSLTSELVAVNAHKKSLFSLIKTKTFFIFIFGILYITFINPFMMNLSFSLHLCKAKRKASRICQFRPQGLPEGVHRYAERRN